MTVKSFFGKKTFDINLKDGKSICLFFKKKSFFNFSEKDDNTIITILNMCDEFSKRGIDVSLVAGNYGLMIFSLTVIIFCCLSLLFFLLNKNLNPKPIFYYLLGGLIVKAILLFIQSRVFTISHDYMHRDNSKKALIWGS